MTKYEQRGISPHKQELRSFLRENPLDNFYFSENKVLTLHSDTAGTKPVLSYLYWKEFGDLSIWEKIAADVLVMNLDDLAATGFTDNFLVSLTLSVNSLYIPWDVRKKIILSVKKYIQNLQEQGVRIVFLGGETAEVPDAVRLLDVGASVFAQMPLKNFPQLNKEIAPGNLIIGVASFSGNNSSIGTNGITQARHELLSNYYKKFPETYEADLQEFAYVGKFRLSDKAEGRFLGDWMTDPPISYLPLLRKILPEFYANIREIVHCTGGGQTKILQKIPPDMPVKIIKNNLFLLPPFYRLLAKETSLSLYEIFRTFNAGHRLEFYVEKEIAEELVIAVCEAGYNAKIIGECVPSDGKPELEIHYQNQKFTYLWS